MYSEVFWKVKSIFYRTIKCKAKEQKKMYYKYYSEAVSHTKVYF